ncbi:hypothetical protein [Arsenicicoccus dermatophilus]|uniref:hypothetical protein n=1 Tax=Arsenicicoccus dermatophilus TaxID=1076331 RepID=UPI003916DEA0
MKGIPRLLAACVLGTSLGLTNSLANVFGGPYAPHPLRPDGVWGLQLLAAVLGTTWAWAAGAPRPDRRACTARRHRCWGD